MTDDPTELRAEIDALRARLDALEAPTAEQSPRSGRRHLLKLAAATVAGAGATTLLAAKPAAANSGDPMILGGDNVSAGYTQVACTDDSYGLLVRTTGAGSAAVAGKSGGFGITGDGGVIGVVGTSSGGASATTAGVVGQLFQASTLLSHGILAFGAVDVVADGTGRTQQKLQSAAGAPTGSATAYAAGEQVRDKNGDLFLCTVSGSPGSWKKVGALLPGYVGGTTHYLSTPIRLLDTRPGQPAATNPGTTITPTTPYDLQVTGKAVGSVAVPSAATGVLLNVTVLNAAAPAYAVLYPTGTTRPGTSSVNVAKGAVTANFAAVRIGSAGKITIATSGSPLDVIVDATGFTA